jgi:hypothetical protein
VPGAGGAARPRQPRRPNPHRASVTGIPARRVLRVGIAGDQGPERLEHSGTSPRHWNHPTVMPSYRLIRLGVVHGHRRVRQRRGLDRAGRQAPSTSCRGDRCHPGGGVGCHRGDVGRGSQARKLATQPTVLTQQFDLVHGRYPPLHALVRLEKASHIRRQGTGASFLTGTWSTIRSR